MDLNTASSLSNQELGRQGWTIRVPLVSHGLPIPTPVYVAGKSASGTSQPYTGALRHQSLALGALTTPPSRGMACLTRLRPPPPKSWGSPDLLIPSCRAFRRRQIHQMHTSPSPGSRFAPPLAVGVSLPSPLPRGWASLGRATFSVDTVASYAYSPSTSSPSAGADVSAWTQVVGDQHGPSGDRGFSPRLGPASLSKGISLSHLGRRRDRHLRSDQVLCVQDSETGRHTDRTQRGLAVGRTFAAKRQQGVSDLCMATWRPALLPT